MAAPYQLIRDQRGNSMVELALVLPVLATLLVGVVDISRAYSAKLHLEQSAQRTIELMQRSSYQPAANTTYQAVAQSAAGTGSAAVITNWLECNNDGAHLDFSTGSCATGAPYARYVQVRITQDFTPMFGSRFFPGANSNGTYTVAATAGLRVQ